MASEVKGETAVYHAPNGVSIWGVPHVVRGIAVPGRSVFGCEVDRQSPISDTKTADACPTVDSRASRYGEPFKSCAALRLARWLNATIFKKVARCADGVH